MTKIPKLKILFLFSIFYFLFSAALVEAATLYFSPSSGSFGIGQTFSAAVYVSSEDQTMNAASGVISFPKDKLEITSLSQSGSIFSLWVQEPVFSKSAGTVQFEGIVLNPGFTGSAGKIISVNFKVKSGGLASLRFSSGSVLANDGRGTNILADLGTANFNLATGGITPMTPETTTPSSSLGAPAPPHVSSSTHPDQNKWYSETKAKFNWDLPSDVTAVRVLIDKNSHSIPGVNYAPPISSKEIADLDDGIWYFHIQFRNSYGWGAISHFRVQIDTKSPEPFSIKIIDGKETENPRPTIVFNTVDTGSGIDYYKVKIGDSDFLDISQEEVKSNPYTLHPQMPGKHTILVQAFDKAHNHTVAVEEFVVKAIESPKITDYPQKLYSGEPLIVKGTTYPNVQITLWLQREDDKAESQSIKSDENGNFALVYKENLKDGIYKMWAEAVNEQGAVSYPSEKLTFIVALPSVLKFGKIAINYLTILITLLILIAVLGGIIFYVFYRISLWRKKLRKQTKEAEGALEKAFWALRQEVKEQIEKFDKKPGLSKSEKEISDKLQKALNIAEKFIGKEIKDVKRELDKR